MEFSIATNKRTGSLKARKIRYLDPSKKVKTVQGIVSSLKESFGFIERADIVAEIFFHYTEYNGNVSDLMIGDDVQFNLQDRHVCNYEPFYLQKHFSFEGDVYLQ